MSEPFYITENNKPKHIGELLLDTIKPATRKTQCKICKQQINKGETKALVKILAVSYTYIGYNPKWGIASWRYPTKRKNYYTKINVCINCINKSREILQKIRKKQQMKNLAKTLSDYEAWSLAENYKLIYRNIKYRDNLSVRASSLFAENLAIFHRRIYGLRCELKHLQTLR